MKITNRTTKTSKTPIPAIALRYISGRPLRPFAALKIPSFAASRNDAMPLIANAFLSTGERKHTVVNAEQTGWFVWNMATYDLREAVNISAMELPAGEDEFARAGVTKAPCIDAPGPRVAESPAQFECRYLSTHRLRGSSPHGWVDVVYGEVMRIHVADEVITPEGKLDIPAIRPLARLGYYDYTSVTETFEMKIPSDNPATLQGLEGKS